MSDKSVATDGPSQRTETLMSQGGRRLKSPRHALALFIGYSSWKSGCRG